MLEYLSKLIESHAVCIHIYTYIYIYVKIISKCLKTTRNNKKVTSSQSHKQIEYRCKMRGNHTKNLNIIQNVQTSRTTVWKSWENLWKACKIIENHANMLEDHAKMLEITLKWVKIMVKCMNITLKCAKIMLKCVNMCEHHAKMRENAWKSR